jgi:hypothetical protein
MHTLDKSLPLIIEHFEEDRTIIHSLSQVPGLVVRPFESFLQLFQVSDESWKIQLLQFSDHFLGYLLVAVGGLQRKVHYIRKLTTAAEITPPVFLLRLKEPVFSNSPAFSVCPC